MQFVSNKLLSAWKKRIHKKRGEKNLLNGTFTNQCRMSALQCIPRETRDHFARLCVLKSHYATTSLLAPLVFIVKYCCKKSPVISLLTIFLVVVPLQHFGFFLFFPVQDHRGLFFFKAFTFQRHSCIQMTHLAEPKTTFKASVM